MGEIFQTWLQMLYAVKKSGKPLHFVREHDKKVCILGLASLLAVPSAAMPPELQSGFCWLLTRNSVKRKWMALEMVVWGKCLWRWVTMAWCRERRQIQGTFCARFAEGR